MTATSDYPSIPGGVSNRLPSSTIPRREQPAAPYDGRLELLRVAAILGVFIQHAGFSRYGDSVLFVIDNLQEMFGWCVIAFFAVSGRLTAPKTSIKTFVKRRSLRLLIPFVFASLVSFVAMHAIFASGVYVPRGGAPQLSGLVWSLLTLHGFGPHLYFLPYLFLIGLGSLVLVQLLPQWAWLALAVAGAVIASIALSTPPSPHGAQWANLPFYWLTFLLGHAFRDEYSKKLPIILLSGLVTWGIVRLTIANDAYILHLSIPFLLYAMLPSRAARIRVPINVGAIYLWHTPILMPAICVLLAFVGIPDFANLILTILLASACSLVFDHLLRYLPWGRFLTL